MKKASVPGILTVHQTPPTGGTQWRHNLHFDRKLDPKIRCLHKPCFISHFADILHHILQLPFRLPLHLQADVFVDVLRLPLNADGQVKHGDLRYWGVDNNAVQLSTPGRRKIKMFEV